MLNLQKQSSMSGEESEESESEEEVYGFTPPDSYYSEVAYQQRKEASKICELS
jgi:hypothetical protein